jgi:catechol 2,3-dioxygenase-like lactoylglutathione lyase family enzyme
MDNASILNHVSIGTNDLDRATRFYDQVLAV